MLNATVETKGESLINGLRNLVEDLERGGGRLSLKMSDLAAFRFGENIASSPGKVVFQNELMQLIQYSPSTPMVHRRPLLIVPPWINKFYILDLKPKNSFIKWCVDQGHTVFVISWVNPGAELAGKGFSDYLLEGPLAASTRSNRRPGKPRSNVIGYCIGGTLIASTLAYMAATSDKRIASATLFTTLLDFSDVGDISVFIDDDQLKLADKHMHRLGYLEGRHMAEAFNLMRENDLIWFFCREQLSAGSRSGGVRHPVLEFGCDPHAGDDAILLSAQHVSPECTEECRRNHPRQRTHRSAENRCSGLFPVDP